MIVCWAMGLTQHRDAVATIQEITNLLLLRGNIGKRGAGVCPVRGHSNVQGDRTMGIWEKAHDSLLDGLRDEFGFEPHARARARLGRHASARCATAGSARSSRWAATSSRRPRTPTRTEEAMRGLDLTVHVSTKLNRSHVVAGREALILPCLGRTERDRQAAATRSSPSRTRWAWCTPRGAGWSPASPHLLSEVAIVTAAGRGALAGRRPGHRLGSDARGLRGDPRPHRAGDPGLRRLQRAHRGAGRLRAAAPAA